jgi:hypothetical protein
LPNLYSLLINHVHAIENDTQIYRRIFRLPVLKYCKVSFRPSYDLDNLLPIADKESSPIEHLIITTSVQFDEIDNLLSYVPQLRSLSINCLDGVYSKRTELSPIMLNHLTDVSLLECHYIYFNQFETLVKNLFNQVQVLRLRTHLDDTYLDGDRWEQLILSHMTNLRVFHIHHRGSLCYDNNQLSTDLLINKFTSSFFVERQCFFTHQRDWRGSFAIEIFYSIDPNKYEIVYFFF